MRNNQKQNVWTVVQLVGLVLLLMSIVNPVLAAPHCKGCPVGFGAATPCTSTRSAKCAACVLGRTFSNAVDDSPCQPVSPTSLVLCNVGANRNERKILADTTHDVMCVCVDGFERDQGSGQCRPESPQPPMTELSKVPAAPTPSVGSDLLPEWGVIALSIGLFAVAVAAGTLAWRKWKSKRGFNCCSWKSCSYKSNNKKKPPVSAVQVTDDSEPGASGKSVLAFGGSTYR